MYKAIRQLAEDAIAVQNKISMESALKDIAIMCAEAELLDESEKNEDSNNQAQEPALDESEATPEVETQKPETKKGKK